MFMPRFSFLFCRLKWSTLRYLRWEMRESSKIKAWGHQEQRRFHRWKSGGKIYNVLNSMLYLNGMFLMLFINRCAFSSWGKWNWRTLSFDIRKTKLLSIMGFRWKWCSSDTHVTVLKICLLQVINWSEIMPVFIRASHRIYICKRENSRNDKSRLVYLDYLFLFGFICKQMYLFNA